MFKQRDILVLLHLLFALLFKCVLSLVAHAKEVVHVAARETVLQQAQLALAFDMLLLDFLVQPTEVHLLLAIPAELLDMLRLYPNPGEGRYLRSESLQLSESSRGVQIK